MRRSRGTLKLPAVPQHLGPTTTRLVFNRADERIYRGVGTPDAMAVGHVVQDAGGICMQTLDPAALRLEAARIVEVDELPAGICWERMVPDAA